MPTTEIGIDGADDQRRAEVPQEQEDDQDDQARADHHVLLHGVDRALDELGAVVEQRQLDARHLAVDALELGAHAFGNLHRVGARLLGDLHADALAAVDPQHRSVVFGRVGDLGDVPHVDRNAALGQDHQVADLLEVLELSLAPQQQRAIALVDLADRDVLRSPAAAR